MTCHLRGAAGLLSENGIPKLITELKVKEGKKVHVRSASRAGRGDLGVTRARVEEIRTAFGE